MADSNKPFHDWITGYDAPLSSSAVVKPERGWIRTDTESVDMDSKAIPDRRLYFLYNPSTVRTSYSMQLDAAVTGALFQKKTGGSFKAVAPLQQTLDFSLLFDRTYEISYPGVANTTPEMAAEGAWRDVRAALSLAGVLDNVEATGGTIGTAGSLAASGAMIPYPMYFHFGNGESGLDYYGYLQSLTIEYTHFSKNMVPIRVGMGMSAILLPSNRELFAPAAPDFPNIPGTPGSVGGFPDIPGTPGSAGPYAGDDFGGGEFSSPFNFGPIQTGNIWGGIVS